MSRHRWTWGRIVGGMLLGLGAFLAIATVRVLLDGRRHMDRAEKLLREGDSPAAFASLEDAARSYVPGSPYPPRALEKMALMARGAEMRGERDRAMTAWQSIRRSVLATRNITIPNEDFLTRSEHELARLEPHGPGAEDGSAPPARRPRDPSAFLSLLLFAGLSVWIVSAAALTVLPREQGRARWRRYAWATCLAGLVMWVAMSWLAG